MPTNNEEKEKEESSECSLLSVSKDKNRELPPPLPEPVYSFYKRVLPESLIALNSPKGRSLFLDLSSNSNSSNSSMETYFALAEHFMNQSEPAYCGVTTLAMMLNVCQVDPSNVRWKGGWRYFHNEQSVLSTCKCYLNHPDYISRVGITMHEFQTLASCHDLKLDCHFASPSSSTNNNNNNNINNSSLEQFRRHVQQAFSPTSSTTSTSTTVNNKLFITVSFARGALNQTGDGHFSPLAAYHESTDQVLILDVARFKYTPYWVSLSKLYHAMTELDPTTQSSRGWFIIHHPPNNTNQNSSQTNNNTTDDNMDGRKMAHNLPLMEHIQIQNQQTIIQKIHNNPNTIPSCRHHPRRPPQQTKESSS